jgi:hypothetical protein
MVVLIAEALILAVALFAVPWAMRQPVRFLPLSTGIGGGIALTVVWLRHEDLEMAFWAVFAAFCLAAGAMSALGSYALRQGRRRSIWYGVLASSLVLPVFYAYIPARLTLCFFASDPCYV